MDPQRRGLLLVLFTSVCLSTVPTAIKLGLGDAEPTQLLAPRMIIGAALLWLYLAIRRPERLRIERAGKWTSALAGGLNAISLLLFYMALGRIGVGLVMLVFSAYPVLLLGLLALRGHTITRLDWMRLAMALAGIRARVGRRRVLRGDPGAGIEIEIDSVGFALAVTCALLYAIYMVILQERLTLYPASTTTVWIISWMALAALLMSIASPAPRPARIHRLGGGAVVAIIGTAVSRVAAVEGVRLIGSGKVALLMPAETVLSVSWAALFLGERLTAIQLLGAALIIGSVALAAVGRLAARPRLTARV